MKILQENPKTLYYGYVVILLEGNYWASLYTHEKKEAIRTKIEIDCYEGKIVEVTGRCLSTIPQQGNTMRAACFIEIHSIKLHKK